MGKFKRGQRVKIVKGKHRVPHLAKLIGREGKIGREDFMAPPVDVEGKRITNEMRGSRYYVRLDKLGIYEYFPEDWLEPLEQ
jgi:hypothetical protein